MVYGEAMGILAGDGLLNFAYETALKAWEMEPSDPHVGKALQILAGNAGIYGMLGGQVVDVESEGQSLSREKLDFIYELKTGALIESAMLIGAVLAGADQDAQEKISGRRRMWDWRSRSRMTFWMSSATRPCLASRWAATRRIRRPPM